MLRIKISGSFSKAGPFRDVLAKLLTMGDVEAETITRAMVTGPIPSGGDERRRVVYSTAELLSHRPRQWSLIWPIFQANEDFGVEVLQLVAYEHEFNSFATQIDEGDVASICIWLSRLGCEKVLNRDEAGLVTPDKALAQWWNTLINLLTYKGTVKACNAIQRLIRALPQYERGLRRSLREAEERTRQVTWVAPSPEEVIGLVSESGMRLIRNGRELIGMLIESLNRLELLLQGVTPSAEDLWNELPRARDQPRVFRPKGETSFSDYIKRHLDRDLREVGVILNREVEIRSPKGGKEGEDTDILVDAVVPQDQSERPERISVVIEAKGCWNPALNHAMRSQLGGEVHGRQWNWSWDISCWVVRLLTMGPQ
jgi:hypothetical protein